MQEVALDRVRGPERVGERLAADGAFVVLVGRRASALAETAERIGPDRCATLALARQKPCRCRAPAILFGFDRCSPMLPTAPCFQLRFAFERR